MHTPELILQTEKCMNLHTKYAWHKIWNIISLFGARCSRTDCNNVKPLRTDITTCFMTYSSTSRLLRNEIFAVYYKNNTEHINALCGYDTGFLMLTHTVHISIAGLGRIKPAPPRRGIYAHVSANYEPSGKGNVGNHLTVRRKWNAYETSVCFCSVEGKRYLNYELIISCRKIYLLLRCFQN
jgi:hypothetical protein